MMMKGRSDMKTSAPPWMTSDGLSSPWRLMDGAAFVLSLVVFPGGCRTGVFWTVSAT